jgi:hypothetical protein
MQGGQKDSVTVNVNVALTAGAMEALAANAREINQRDAEGPARVDPADLISVMISQFLLVKDFEGFVGDPGNYPELV